MMRLFLSVLLLVPSSLLFSQQLTPDVIQGKVVGITDGDTLTILMDKKQYKIRLAEIDTPERGQPYGSKAKDILSDMVPHPSGNSSLLCLAPRRHSQGGMFCASGSDHRPLLATLASASTSSKDLSLRYCRYTQAAREWTGNQLYKTREDAIADVREYVAVYYNSKRLHSTLDYMTPMDYEKTLNKVSGNS
jgi:hypothetical protein